MVTIEVTIYKIVTFIVALVKRCNFETLCHRAKKLCGTLQKLCSQPCGECQTIHAYTHADLDKCLTLFIILTIDVTSLSSSFNKSFYLQNVQMVIDDNVYASIVIYFSTGRRYSVGFQH